MASTFIVHVRYQDQPPATSNPAMNPLAGHLPLTYKICQSIAVKGYSYLKQLLFLAIHLNLNLTIVNSTTQSYHPMNIAELEKSLAKLMLTKHHIESVGTDPLLIEDYEGQLQDLKLQYGRYLDDLLFDIYDDYCEDDPCPELTEFLKNPSVVVHPEDFPNETAILSMLIHPLRFQLSDPDHTYEEVIWKIAS